MKDTTRFLTGSAYLTLHAVTETLRALVGLNSVNPAHTADEFVELDRVLTGARFLADLIGRVLPE
jgi:acetylornithine deacetylase/succinyl-diaminopimelate desuccinylase-like protein